MSSIIEKRVVWIHGAAWWAGNKDSPNPARSLVDEGFAVAVINYRLSQQCPFPAQLSDCKSAIRWLRDHATGSISTPTRSASGAPRQVVISLLSWASPARRLPGKIRIARENGGMLMAGLELPPASRRLANRCW